MFGIHRHTVPRIVGRTAQRIASSVPLKKTALNSITRGVPAMQNFPDYLEEAAKDSFFTLTGNHLEDYYP